MRTCVSLILGLYVAAATAANAQTTPLYSFGDRIPLGIEAFRLQPANRNFYLMASVENPLFVGIHRTANHEGHDQLFDADNKQVLFYPSRVQFRLTASSREKLIDDRPLDAHAKIALNDLLAKLHFRVKVFHALEYRYIKPAFVENVGLPKNVPYDERIYRIGFDLGKIPIEDRVVMEVFSPTGERLCKFHLDLL